MIYLSTIMEAYNDRLIELKYELDNTGFMFEKVEIDDQIKLLQTSLKEEAIVEFARLEEMYETGILDNEQFGVASNGLIESGVKIGKTIKPYFMEASEAKFSSIVMTEVKAFATVSGAKALAYGINKALGLILKKFIISRLSRYTVLHPKVEPFKNFTASPYDAEEIRDKIKFQSIHKWNEDAGVAVSIRVYKDDNDKPQCAIATAQKKGPGMFGSDKGPRKVETVILNPKLNAHKDYYAACMAVAQGVFSAPVKRVITYLSKAWIKEKENLIKGIKESAIEDGKFTEDKISLAREAYNNNEITLNDLETYVEFLESVEDQIYTFNDI